MLAESGFFYVICRVGYQMYKQCHPGHLTHLLHVTRHVTRLQRYFHRVLLKRNTLLLLTAVSLKCVSGTRNDSLPAATE